MKCWFKCGTRVGIFLVFLFIVCFVWYWLHPVNQELHQEMLELLFYGFRGMNLPSFALGVIQSFVWGYIFTALWILASCCCCKKECKTNQQ